MQDNSFCGACHSWDGKDLLDWCLKLLFSSPACGLWDPNNAPGSQGKTACGFGFPQLNFLFTGLSAMSGRKACSEVPEPVLSHNCVLEFASRAMSDNPLRLDHEVSALIYLTLLPSTPDGSVLRAPPKAAQAFLGLGVPKLEKPQSFKNRKCINSINDGGSGVPLFLEALPSPGPLQPAEFW